MPGYSSSEFSDEIFSFFPEIDFFQKWVHPAINDAITSIKLPCVVSMVLLVAENESSGLEESNDGVRFFVDHMSPFVDFIG